MKYVRDEDIPCTKTPNPILDAVAEGRELKLENLYLPTIPLPVATIANQVAHGLIVMEMIGLVVRLRGKDRVSIKPRLAEYAGLDRYQLKRTLQGLQSVGLIRVERLPGKRRQISLLDDRYLTRLLSKT